MPLACTTSLIWEHDSKSIFSNWGDGGRGYRNSNCVLKKPWRTIEYQDLKRHLVRQQARHHLQLPLDTELLQSSQQEPFQNHSWRQAYCHPWARCCPQLLSSLSVCMGRSPQGGGTQAATTSPSQVQTVTDMDWTCERSGTQSQHSTCQHPKYLL